MTDSTIRYIDLTERMGVTYVAVGHVVKRTNRFVEISLPIGNIRFNHSGNQIGVRFPCRVITQQRYEELLPEHTLNMHKRALITAIREVEELSVAQPSRIISALENALNLAHILNNMMKETNESL